MRREATPKRTDALPSTRSFAFCLPWATTRGLIVPDSLERPVDNCAGTSAPVRRLGFRTG